MNYYTSCPNCGYKLLKASEGSAFEIYCPKCGNKMNIEAKDGRLVIQKLLTSKVQDDD